MKKLLAIMGLALVAMGASAGLWTGPTLPGAGGGGSATNAIALVDGNGTNTTFYDSAGLLSLPVTDRQLVDTNGDPKLEWSSGKTWDVNGFLSGNWFTRLLTDSTEVGSVDWENRELLGAWTSTNLTAVGFVASSSGVSTNQNLYDSTGGLSQSATDRQLSDTNETPTLDWGTYQMWGGAGFLSIGWSDRLLYSSTETPTLDWQNKALLGTWTATNLAGNFTGTLSGNTNIEPSTNFVTRYYGTLNYYQATNVDVDLGQTGTNAFVLLATNALTYLRFTNAPSATFYGEARVKIIALTDTVVLVSTNRGTQFPTNSLWSLSGVYRTNTLGAGATMRIGVDSFGVANNTNVNWSATHN